MDAANDSTVASIPLVRTFDHDADPQVEQEEAKSRDRNFHPMNFMTIDGSVGETYSNGETVSLCVTPTYERAPAIETHESRSEETTKDDTYMDRNERCRRRSSRLANLKSDLIASGASFRPRGSIIELYPPTSTTTSEMRSSSVRPGSRSSSGASGSRAPSLPPVPRNRKYAHVQSRTVNRSEHVRPESQVRITHKPLKIEAKSKVGSLSNIQHTPGGGDKKILQRKLNFKERAQPRIESHQSLQTIQKLNSKEPTPRSPTALQNSSSLPFEREESDRS
ncbi:Microtubule-associated protein [Aphelenchoides fujianensis]|nr:Microtubule-associated protein [Aphelenchoides fujianensis]